jgi:hypothetical protein
VDVHQYLMSKGIHRKQVVLVEAEAGGVVDVEEVVAVVAAVEEEDLPWLENSEMTLRDQMAMKILSWLELMICIMSMQQMVVIKMKQMNMLNDPHYQSIHSRPLI